jgi:hypothetical protein
MDLGFCEECLYCNMCDANPNSECLNFIDSELYNDTFIVGTWNEMSYFRYTEDSLNYGQETDWDLYLTLDEKCYTKELVYQK